MRRESAAISLRAHLRGLHLMTIIFRTGLLALALATVAMPAGAASAPGTGHNMSPAAKRSLPIMRSAVGCRITCDSNGDNCHDVCR